MENNRYNHYPFKVYTYDIVDSTNAVAKRAIGEFGREFDLTVHVAGSQTKGRGRKDRAWLNTEEAVLMSIVHRAALSSDRLPMLNLAAAEAVRNALVKLTGNDIDLSVKWPNDVITSFDMKKICGILSESLYLKGDRFAVIGIGVNLNTGSIPGDLLQPASSVYLECGRRFRILDVVNAILDEYMLQYDLLRSDPDEFLRCFSKNCISLGSHVAVIRGDETRYGMADRIFGDGRLVVRYEDGAIEEVGAADVSIRSRGGIDDKLIKRILPKRDPKGNKGSNGRAALIVGSGSMPGAALMCSKACVRAGAGLTRALIPKEIVPSFALVPEVMLVPETESADELIKWASAVGIGCGMGVSERTAGLLEKVLRSGKPCVIDADALNTMASKPELMALLHAKAVITPHPGEMARLLGCETEEVVKNFTASAVDFANEHGCCVLLKSASSIIVSPKGAVRYNDRGSSALAKGGSGDVLTGIVASLLAQGAKPYDAASAGAYLLGVSAEHAMELLRERFICASDVTEMISKELERGAGNDTEG